MRVSSLILIFLFSFSILPAQERGAQIFSQSCGACHKMGMRLVGPDLTGVHEKRSEEWLKRFINSSQTMIKEGDEQAIAIFNEYNNIPMPDANLNDDEMDEVLAYIASFSNPKVEKEEEVVTVQAAATTGSASPFASMAFFLTIGILLIVVAILYNASKMLSTIQQLKK